LNVRGETGILQPETIAQAEKTQATITGDDKMCPKYRAAKPFVCIATMWLAFVRFPE
jgi:hypothetical protein